MVLYVSLILDGLRYLILVSFQQFSFSWLTLFFHIFSFATDLRASYLKTNYTVVTATTHCYTHSVSHLFEKKKKVEPKDLECTYCIREWCEELLSFLGEVRLKWTRFFAIILSTWLKVYCRNCIVFLVYFIVEKPGHHMLAFQPFHS